MNDCFVHRLSAYLQKKVLNSLPDVRELYESCSSCFNLLNKQNKYLVYCGVLMTLKALYKDHLLHGLVISFAALE